MSNFLNSIASNFKTMPWFQIGISFLTVFVGLICIVILCKIIGLFCIGSRKKEAETKIDTIEKPQNEEEIVAAVTAACAEALGKDVKALKVVSFKKI